MFVRNKIYLSFLKIYIQIIIEYSSNYIKKMRFIVAGLGTPPLSRTRLFSVFTWTRKQNRKTEIHWWNSKPGWNEISPESCLQETDQGLVKRIWEWYSISANRLSTNSWFGLSNCHNVCYFPKYYFLKCWST